MQKFSALLALCEGIHRLQVVSLRTEPAMWRVVVSIVEQTVELLVRDALTTCDVIVKLTTLPLAATSVSAPFLKFSHKHGV